VPVAELVLGHAPNAIRRCRRRNRYEHIPSADAACCHVVHGQSGDPSRIGNPIWQLLLGRLQPDLSGVLQSRLLRQGSPDLFDCRLQGEVLRADGHRVAIAIQAVPRLLPLRKVARVRPVPRAHRIGRQCQTSRPEVPGVAAGRVQPPPKLDGSRFLFCSGGIGG
jgi:hypothetical protein